MGRSVSYPTNAVVAYSTFEGEDADDFRFEVIEAFRGVIADMYPSAYECDRWIGREDHAVMENGHAYFGVSEYCGLVAYWVVAKDYADSEALADRWVASIAKRFQATFGTLRRLGTFSNGEGVFQQVAA